MILLYVVVVFTPCQNNIVLYFQSTSYSIVAISINNICLSVNFLSVRYMFYTLSCTIAVKSVKSKKKTHRFSTSKQSDIMYSDNLVKDYDADFLIFLYTLQKRSVYMPFSKSVLLSFLSSLPIFTITVKTYT